jgi:hypothetical protein
MMDLLDGKNAVAIYEVMFDECGAAEVVERYLLIECLFAWRRSILARTPRKSVDPSHSVGAASCAEVPGYFKCLQVQDCDLIFSGDGDVGS